MPVSAAVVEKKHQATLCFLPGFHQSLEGEMKAGGRISIEYSPDRVPCRRERLGVQIGRLIQFIRFEPNDRTYRGEGTHFSAPIPGDATEAEVWFYSWNPMACSGWDSRYGANYRYSVAGPTSRTDSVMRRRDSVTAPEMVNSFVDSGKKVLHYFDVDPGNGRELQTRLAVKAWVRNIEYDKSVWMDAHVYDAGGQRVHAGTFKLQYSEAAGGGGDLFSFDGKVYQGSGGGPGSAWNAPDARSVEFRLYYAVRDRVFTDGLLHTFELQADDAVWNAPPERD